MEDGRELGLLTLKGLSEHGVLGFFLGPREDCIALVRMSWARAQHLEREGYHGMITWGYRFRQREHMCDVLSSNEAVALWLTSIRHGLPCLTLRATTFIAQRRILQSLNYDATASKHYVKDAGDYQRIVANDNSDDLRDTQAKRPGYYHDTLLPRQAQEEFRRAIGSMPTDQAYHVCLANTNERTTPKRATIPLRSHTLWKQSANRS